MNIYRAKQAKWLEEHCNSDIDVMHGITTSSSVAFDYDRLFAYRQGDNENTWEIDVAISHIPASIELNSSAYKTAYHAIRTNRLPHNGLPVHMFPNNVAEDICALRIGEEKPAFVSVLR